ARPLPRGDYPPTRAPGRDAAPAPRIPDHAADGVPRPRATPLSRSATRARARRADACAASGLAASYGCRGGGMSDIAIAKGLVLRIKGTDFGGWLTMRVRRDVEAAASTFECEVSERWPGRAEPWRITPGDEVSVLLDGELVITGYVDAFSPSFDATSHRVEV